MTSPTRERSPKSMHIRRFGTWMSPKSMHMTRFDTSTFLDVTPKIYDVHRFFSPPSGMCIDFGIWMGWHQHVHRFFKVDVSESRRTSILICWDAKSSMCIDFGMLMAQKFHVHRFLCIDDLKNVMYIDSSSSPKTGTGLPKIDAFEFRG